MSYARQILASSGRKSPFDTDVVVEALSDCIQACIADTDADLGGERPGGHGEVHPALPGLHGRLRGHARRPQPAGRERPERRAAAA